MAWCGQMFVESFSEKKALPCKHSTITSSSSGLLIDPVWPASLQFTFIQSVAKPVCYFRNRCRTFENMTNHQYMHLTFSHPHASLFFECVSNSHNALFITPQLTFLPSANKCSTFWLLTTLHLHKTWLCYWPEVCLKCCIKCKKNNKRTPRYSFFLGWLATHRPHYNTILIIRDEVVSHYKPSKSQSKETGILLKACMLALLRTTDWTPQSSASCVYIHGFISSRP